MDDPEHGEAQRAEVLAAALAGTAAIAANDTGALAAYLAEEWVIVSDSGISARDEFLPLVAGGDLRHTAMDLVGDARVRVYGEAAVVTARVTNTAFYQGQRFDADEWTTDVFVRRDGRWVCVLSHITTASADSPGAGP